MTVSSWQHDGSVPSERLVTSDHVRLETWFLVNRRLVERQRERTWKALREVCALECVVPADIDLAWDLGEAFPDQTFSLVDRTCFAIMRRLGITRAASLDDHLAVVRFGPRRDRAFEIVRQLARGHVCSR